MQGKAGMESYRQFEADRDRGDFEGLPELHATLSGMKVRRPGRCAAATWLPALVPVALLMLYDLTGSLLCNLGGS